MSDQPHLDAARYAQTDLLSVTWPHIGPVVVQTALAGGWQWTAGQGGVQFTVQEGADHGLHTSVAVPATTLSGVFHF